MALKLMSFPQKSAAQTHPLGDKCEQTVQRIADRLRRLDAEQMQVVEIIVAAIQCGRIRAMDIPRVYLRNEPSPEESREQRIKRLMAQIERFQERVEAGASLTRVELDQLIHAAIDLGAETMTKD